MSEIRRYELVNLDGEEEGVEFDDYSQALEAATKSGFAIQANIYEYSDHELVWTPDGSDQWPPAADG